VRGSSTRARTKMLKRMPMAMANDRPMMAESPKAMMVKGVLVQG